MNEVTIKIENAYSDGHESETEVKIEGPSEDYAGDLDEWFNEMVFEYTGDGHGDGRSGKLGSCYVATIIEAEDPNLIGQNFEWID